MPEELPGPAVSTPSGGAGEPWREVPGWPYEVTRRGQVRSLARGKVLKPQRDRDGYKYVELSDRQWRARVHVARLVLLAYKGEPPRPGMEACHKNGHRWDNRLGNLYWGDDKDQAADRERHRRERAARRAAADVTGVKERETGEIEEPAEVPLESATGVSRC